MVASLDESVGKITTALKTKAMFDNSVIVFTTDNGGAPAGFDWFVNCSFFLSRLSENKNKNFSIFLKESGL